MLEGIEERYSDYYSDSGVRQVEVPEGLELLEGGPKVRSSAGKDGSGQTLGPERPLEEDAHVEDARMEEALDEAEERFGTDYRRLLDSATWTEFDWAESERGILGLTEFDPADTLEPWRDTDGEISMEIDRRLDRLGYFPGFSEEDLYHIIGHEGIHAEWFRGVYGAENRELGMPIPTLMALHGAMKAGGNALEAATEYTARRRNPEYGEATVDAYEDEVAELESLLGSLDASMDEEEEEIYQGPECLEGLEVYFADADVDHYLEHGSVGDEEYLLALGDEDSYREYLDWLESEEAREAEVFEYGSPLDPEPGTYEMPEMEEFEEFVEQAYDEDGDPDRYDPSGGAGPAPTYLDVIEGGDCGPDTEVRAEPRVGPAGV